MRGRGQSPRRGAARRDDRRARRAQCRLCVAYLARVARRRLVSRSGLGPDHVTARARCDDRVCRSSRCFAPRARGELRLTLITPDIVLAGIAASAVAARAPFATTRRTREARARLRARTCGSRRTARCVRRYAFRVRGALALGAAALATRGVRHRRHRRDRRHRARARDARRTSRRDLRRLARGSHRHSRARACAARRGPRRGCGRTCRSGGIAGAYAIADRTWLAHGADVACHAPLVAAALFVFGAVFAKLHHRTWLPQAIAAVAALSLWAARGEMLERATAGHGVISDRVAAVIEPGYALLHDGHRFAATASSWREATLPETTEIDRWHGEGLFGARIVDPGVIHSVENDYLPVLVAREDRHFRRRSNDAADPPARRRCRRVREHGAPAREPRASRSLAGCRRDRQHSASINRSRRSACCR